jgi:hypothetical protein
MPCRLRTLAIVPRATLLQIGERALNPGLVRTNVRTNRGRRGIRYEFSPWSGVATGIAPDIDGGPAGRRLDSDRVDASTRAHKASQRCRGSLRAGHERLRSHKGLGPKSRVSVRRVVDSFDKCEPHSRPRF